MSEGRDRKQQQKYGHRRPGSRSPAVWLLTGLALAIPWRADASSPDAYAIIGSELYRLELATAELTSLGAVGVSGVEALAFDPSGVLFAANRDELFTIDPEVPVATLVGPLGLGPTDRPLSMAFDAEGRLWMAATGALHEVDPVSGTAIAIGLDTGLLALAENGGELFGILHGPPPPPGDPPPPDPPQPNVAIIDRATGLAQVLAPLVGLVGTGNPFAAVDDLVFDRRGHAWVLAIDTIGTNPPEAYHRIYRSVDLETGVVELVSERMDLGVSILLRAMALIPDQGIVTIPTLGWGGLAVLCAALIGCALRNLHLRSRR